MKILRFLRFLIASPVFLFALFFFGWLMIVTRPFTYRFHHRLFQCWAKMTLWGSGVQLKVTGVNNLDVTKQYVFACNHQSLLDVPSITKALPMRPRFVAKSSLERIFFFGAIMRQLGTIAIDRKNHEAAMQKLLAARSDPSQANAALVFFAEGTRTKDGEIGPFKKGAVVTALSLQVPIVPMAIAGAFRALPKNSICLKPGPIYLAIGKPIPVGENTPEEKERLMAVTRQAVLDLYESIRHCVPGSESKDENCQAFIEKKDDVSSIQSVQDVLQRSPNAEFLASTSEGFPSPSTHSATPSISADDSDSTQVKPSSVNFPSTDSPSVAPPKNLTSDVSASPSSPSSPSSSPSSSSLPRSSQNSESTGDHASEGGAS